MTNPCTIEAELDRIVAAIANIRALLEEPTKPGSDGETDFLDFNLIPLPEAAYRFGQAKDKLRRWCRDDAIGKQEGKRWKISLPRLRAKLNQL